MHSRIAFSSSECSFNAKAWRLNVAGAFAVVFDATLVVSFAAVAEGKAAASAVLADSDLFCEAVSGDKSFCTTASFFCRRSAASRRRCAGSGRSANRGSATASPAESRSSSSSSLVALELFLLSSVESRSSFSASSISLFRADSALPFSVEIWPVTSFRRLSPPWSTRARRAARFSAAVSTRGASLASPSVAILLLLFSLLSPRLPCESIA